MQMRRNPHLDRLRGLAVLGILPVNIFLLGWPKQALTDPQGSGFLLTLADRVAWSLMHLLFEQKFINLLALVFGIGIALFAERQSARAQPSGSRHVRRMLVLGLFGLLHAYLIWWGDILFLYAVAGLLAWVARDRPPAMLIRTGLLIYAMPSLLLLLWQLSGAATGMSAAVSAPMSDQLRIEILQYQAGWWEQMPHRARTALTLQTTTLLSISLWHALGLMLIGMGLHGRANRMAEYRRCRPHGLWWMLAVGALLMGMSLYLHLNDADPLWAFQSQYWGSLVLSAGYGGAFLLWSMRRPRARLGNRLAAVGRLSLSVYILQSLIGMLLFYGQGAGLFAQLNAPQLLMCAALTILLLLWITPIWEHHLGAGPLERLWRWLAYRQPV